jgi:transposase-like protein
MTNFEIIETGGAGRPSKYSPSVVDRLLASLAAGLTQKQACMACGICENTLAAWRKQYPDLEPRIESAREVARQTALEGIKTAGEKDWRALAEWLKLTFAEYRSGHNINVNATAVNDQRTVVITEAKRKELQAKLKAIQDAHDNEQQSPAPSTPQAQPQANVGAGNAPSGASTAAQTTISTSMRALGFDLDMPESVQEAESTVEPEAVGW